MNSSVFLRVIACVFLAGAVASADIESFETTSVPVGWSADANSTLTVTGERFRSGKAGLLWSWKQSGAALTGTNLTKITSQECFAFWLYNEKPTTHILRLELLKDGNVVGRSWYSLNFKGWRALGAPYAQVMSDLKQGMNSFRLIAPKGVKIGRLYLDYVNPHCRDKLLPDQQQPWVNNPAMLTSPSPEKFIYSTLDISINRPWLPKRVPAHQITEQERHDLETLAKRFPLQRMGGSQDPAAFQTIRSAVNIQRQNGILIGVPLAGRFNSPPDGVDITVLTQRAAAAYFGAKAAKQVKETADLLQLLKDLSDHLQDQGVSVGCGNGPLGPKAEILLSLAGDLGWDLYLRELYLSAFWRGHGAGALVADDLTAPVPGERGQWNNTDFFFNTLWTLPSYLLAVRDDCERRQLMWAWQGFVDRLCDTRNGEPFAPDGTMHHHQQQHVSYGTQMLGRLFTILDKMGGTTSFRPSSATLSTLQLVVTTAAYEADHKVQKTPAWDPASYWVPPNIPGYPGCPHPFKGLAGWALILARYGSPDGTQKIDPDLASLYLALKDDPDDPAVKEFREMGFQPMVFNGHRTLNGAVAAIHRRDDWLVCIVGMNRTRTGFEENWANGAYQGSGPKYTRNGSVFVVSSGKPSSLWESGFQFNGWDWTFIPGATSRLTTPAETMTNGFGGGVLGGGTSLDQDGIWGVDFQTFHKSAFCFGNRVTLITTDVKGPSTVPIITTLYQNSFGGGLGDPFTNAIPENESCWADGVETKKFPSEQVLEAGVGHWLVDNKGTGYYVHPGMAPVHLARRAQEWPYFGLKSLMKDRAKMTNTTEILNPANYNATTGTFALAWIDHGVKPDATECVYTLIPRTTPQAMNQFAAAIPYQIIQKDAQAHILRDNDSQTTGYVIFDAKWSSPLSVLHSVNRPCWVMVKEAGDKLRLSVACTDIESWGWGTRPVYKGDIMLTLTGMWNVRDSGVVVTHRQDTTILRIPFMDFMPVVLTLEPVKPWWRFW